MRIKVITKPFGEIEIDENEIIDFPDGILGFDFVKKFIVLDTDDEKSPFKWLQAYDEAGLAFVIIQPMDFLGVYNLMLSQVELENVEASSVEDLVVFSIVTIPSNPKEMTANLQGPIIINKSKKLGRQAISLNENYSVRHSILEEMKKLSESGEK